MEKVNHELISLALIVVEVLDRRAKAGSHKPPWQDFQNGNGVNIGIDVERLIQKAQRILQMNVS
ncbi:hypothetical protein [Spirosoma spitsbergense]|uniref:hypothetical protein n=1 Tax=Spirosoma spitsbergense TaxID=431554 RepID=UPI0003680AEB|nr:hypothetical protein [Spirosoma spitsbergense]